MDRVTLAVGGQLFEGWKEAHVVRSIDLVAGSFSVSVSEKFPGRPSARELRRGDPLEVRVGDDVVITGYIDTITIETGADGVAVSIEGRDKTGDLVDCSPDLKPSEWKNQKIDRIAEILCEPFGIPVRVEADDIGDAFTKVALSPGETAWDLLEELARYRSLVAMSDGRGALVLSTAGQAGRGDALVHGENLLGSAFVASDLDRFRTYIVKGQRPSTKDVSGVNAASAEGRAIDEGVRRNRPTVIIAGSAVDSGRCAKRARYQATVNAGRSERVSAVLAGWRQSSGALWVPNLRCAFDSDPLGIHAELVVSQVALDQDGNRTTTTLDLVRPDAFAPLPERVDKVGETDFGFSDD